MWKIGIEKVATCDQATMLRALRPSQQCINRYSIATAKKNPKLCRIANLLGLHFSPHLTWYRHPCRTMENREKVTTCHQTSGFYNAEPQAEYRNRFGTTMKYYHEIKMSKVVWAITLSRWLGLHLPRWEGTWRNIIWTTNWTEFHSYRMSKCQRQHYIPTSTQ